MMKRFVLVLLLLVSGSVAWAQTCTPGPLVTCSTNLDMWLPEANYPAWNVPLVDNFEILDTAVFEKQGQLTLTTTGSSGAATLIGDTLNIPQYSGGGSTGFPIILGSTSIAASSTNTIINGIAINGVTLISSGSSGLFLNQAGTYTSAGGGSCPSGSSGQILYNNAGICGAFTMSGDATITTSTGAIVVTKSNGTAFGTAAFATLGNTGTDVPQLSGGLLNNFVINWAAPGTIGSTTPSTGAFTTLSASSTVSGSGFSAYLASPPAIGGTAPGSAAFTTLSASSTVSGAGFSTYLASPPAIGGSAANAGTFTSLTDTGITGSTQCVQVNSSGLLSGTGATCGGGGGSGTVNSGTGGRITWYASTGTAVSGDAKLDDGLTTANVLTYTGTGGILASGGPVGSTPPSGDAGLLYLAGNTTNQTCPTNNFCIFGFTSTSATAYGWQPSTTAPSGTQLMLAATPSSGASAVTYSSALPNGVTATTQSPGDSTTKVATDAFVLANVPSLAFPLTVSGTVTSGGIPYFNSTTQESSSALLGANQIVVGGGAGTAPSSVANAVLASSGLLELGSGAPTNTLGTAGGNVAAEGTAFTGVSATDGWYANSTNHCMDAVYGTTDEGCLAAVGLAQTFSAAQTFSSATTTFGVPGTTTAILKLGSSTATGSVSITPGSAASNFTATLPANTGTVAELNLAETFSAVQTISASNGLVLSAMTGTACLEEVSGVVTSTGSSCGSGGSTAFPVTVSGTVTSGGIPYFNSTTQMSTSAALASGAIVVGGGAGTAPSTDASATLSTGTLSLGASGTLGAVVMGNATTGTITLEPVTGALGTVTASLPANTGTIAELNLVQSFTAAQTIAPTSTSAVGLTINLPTSTTANALVTQVNGSTIAILGNAGLLSLGASPPTPTPGTAGGSVASEGTAYTGASSTDGWYANAANHCVDLLSQTTDEGCAAALGATQTFTGAVTYSGGLINTTTPIRDETRFVLAANMTAVATAGVNIGSTGAGNSTFSWPVTAANWYDLECKLPVTFATTATIRFQLVSISGSVTVSSVNSETMGNTGAAAVFQDLTTIAGTSLAGSETPVTGAPGASETVTYNAQFLSSHAGNIGLEFVANGTNNVTMLLGGECGITQIN